MKTVRPHSRIGVRAIALFFVFGMVMSGLAAFMLLYPGSFLEPLWRLNPRAQVGFSDMGRWAVVLMLVISAACATAAIGLWRGKAFGYRTAVLILTINLLGDLLNAFVAHDWRTLIGLPVGGAMIAYLLSRRAEFTGK